MRSSKEQLAFHRLGGDLLPKMRIESDFEDGEPIPERHAKMSPPLRFADVPGGTKELALIVEDPDAPSPMPFVHWLVYGIPVSTAEMRAGIEEDTPILGARQGKTTMRHQHYDGPAPPPGHGMHHYHFQVFALDTTLDLEPGTGRTELLDAMEGHVIAAGDLIGTFER
ncbi:MAG: YbhB/YbcL family Raf kinase inhibitor-like protein [Polyangiales bacterium]